jgi:hypothetical protein
MSRLTPICTLYGLLYTTFGLGVRHTGQAGRPQPSAGQMADQLGSLSVFLLLD